MDRREFLKIMAVCSATAAFPIPRICLSSEKKPEKPLVVVGKSDDYEKLVNRMLAPLGGMEAFVSKGQKVVIKPNIGWDRLPEHAANTHPTVVKELVKLALQAGAKEVKVFDYTCNDPRRCYVRSGIKAALESINDNRVKLEHIDQRKFLAVEIKNGKSINKWDFYGDALRADVYINVPQAKHHGLTGLSLGLKNTMGVIGGNRGRIHHEIGQKLVDLAQVIRPELTIIDATRILLRNGPQGGNTSDVKQTDTMVATTDPVAADAYATTLFDQVPGSILSTVAAYRQKLGEMDLNKMNIVRV